MLRIKTFYLFLVSVMILVVLLPQAQKDLISYSVFAVLTGTLFWLSWVILEANRRRAKTNIKSSGQLVWLRLSRNKNAIFGMIVLILLSYIAILAPFICPHDPLNIDWGALSQGISASYWLGTDDLGRDIFSRNIYGIRVALGIGVTAVILNTIIGSFLGLMAGYYGGKIDNIIMRLLEVWNSIPFILLAIAIMAALGTGITKLILIVSLSNLMAFARIIRGEVLTTKEADYIAAARVIGIGDWKIIRTHIIPNSISPVLVLASLSVGETILVIAGLSFLGLGIQPPMASLGGMLSNGQQFLHQNLLMSVVPGVTILLIVLSFNLFGDGVRDALDSKLSD